MISASMLPVSLPGVPGFLPPPRPSIPVPPINLPKPLSEREFFEERQRLLMEDK